MAADDPRAELGDLLPRPDPTRLTTDQLRRELSALREILTARLDGMDRATALLDETVNRTPTVIQVEITHVRELMEEKFANVDERFHAAEVAVASALSSASKAVDKAEAAAEKQFEGINEFRAQLSDQAATFIDRREYEAVHKQVVDATDDLRQALSEVVATIVPRPEVETLRNGILDRLDATTDRNNDAVAALRSRLDRGEGSTEGGTVTRTATGQAILLALLGISTIISIVSVVIALYVATHHP